ncbi:MAG: L-histidine N(alpha)-methyltransferase [Chitinophagales bacterium]|nr:L-histidine N(alpha)-methyltransferase [Chitinophagales bacterium]
MTVQTTDTTFAREVLNGLTTSPKRLPTRFIYDDNGTKLFEEIMQQEEYYLTNCEKEIIENNLDVFRKIVDSDPFNIVELGAGNGAKTKIMLSHMIDSGADIEYYPIDISEKALDILYGSLKSEIEGLRITPLQKDYFDGLSWLHEKDSKRNFVLFMGANIGNLGGEFLKDFLSKLRRNLNSNDLVMIGFDLVKDYRVIEKAYNDSKKITQAFTLNILKRANRELGATFNLENFVHYNYYDPIIQANKAYIVSKEKQSVYIDALNLTFEFEEWEPISIEHSYKFNVYQIEKIAGKYGFKLKKNLFDKRSYFCDSIWEVS